MRSTIVATLLLLVLAATGVQAQSRGVDTDLEAAVGQFLRDNGNRAVGDLTFAELHRLLARASVLRQQQAHIRKSAVLSYLVPGAGHFMNGDVAFGLLFTAGDLAIGAGTLVGAYFLLPPSVQLGALDYLNDSAATIEARWEALSLMDLLPAVGVLAGGTILDSLYRVLAAKSAAGLARKRIETGDIIFEPRLTFRAGRGMMVEMHAAF